MPAPDEQTLRRFLLGQLPASEAAPVEAYLETHPDTARDLDRLTADDPLTAALRGRTADPAVPPEAEVLARKLESLPAEQTRSAAGDSSGEWSAGRTDEDVTALLGPPRGPGELGWLGDFRVVRVLGRGGMGVVFEAEDPKLGRRVAVKAMLPRLAADPLAKQRFVREAQAAAAVEHDHVVPIHLIGEAGGVPFLVMPFLKGESLDGRLKRDGTLPVAEVVRIGREVAEGLAAAHARGLVHRDIKPGNLWLEAPRGRVKVLDFGLARPVAAGPGVEITQSGAVVGTPAYMSPEQGRGLPVDFRTDLFSLGGVLYRAATGRTPFTAADAAGMLMALAADTPADPRRFNPKLPGPLAGLILRLLEKDPANRPASAAEVARLLAPAVEPLAGEERRPEFDFDDTEVVPEARPVPPPRPRYGRWVAAAVALLGLGIGLLFAPTVIRVVTNKGELVIEVDDPRIEVVVKGPNAEVHDKSRDRRYVLKAGDGRVEFLDPDGGAGGLTKTFTITRGGKTVVRATMAEVTARPKPAPKPGPVPPPGPARPPEPAADDHPILVDGGDWRMEGDELIQAKPGIACLMFGDPAWTDYDVAVETKTLPGPKNAQGALLYVRATARDNYVNFILGSYGGTSDEAAWVRNGKWGRDKTLARTTHQTNRWYRMRVEVRGNRVRCHLDGRELFDFQTDQFPNGRVGLGTWNTAIRWRNLTVTAPDGRVLYKGFPDLPPARNLYPGELLAYETFDDPKLAPPDRLDEPGTPIGVAGGAKVIHFVKLGEGSYASVPFGGPAADMAFAARVRGTGAGPFAEFRYRKTAERSSRLEFEAGSDGRWQLRFVAWDWTAGKEWRLVDRKVLAESEAPDPELADGKWFTLAARSQGPATEVWANGRRLARVTGPELPDADLPPGPEVVALGGRVWRAGPARVEFDYAAVWKLPPGRYTNALGMEFARVPAGRSWLGGGAGRPGDRAVEFKDDFYLGVYEVTQEEWEKVMGVNPSHFQRAGGGKDAVKDVPDADLKRFPVETVSYEDIQTFLAKLNERAKESGWVYRLPTGDEWEYACRGGPLRDRAESAYDAYFDKPVVGLPPELANAKHANGLNRPARVGSYPANPLGLYDMIGNVWELCEEEVAYKGQPKGKPGRRLRGGFWGDDVQFCRAAGLGWAVTGHRANAIGFRVARVRVPAGPKK